MSGFELRSSPDQMSNLDLKLFIEEKCKVLIYKLVPKSGLRDGF